MEQDQAKRYLLRPFARRIGTFNLLPHFVGAAVAFFVYQLVVETVFSRLSIERDTAIFIPELLIFGLVATSLFLYARLRQLRSEGDASSPARPAHNQEIVAARIESLLSKRLAALYHGIDHSLSAIMFFVRAQLGRASAPQLQRDLREVMERIDQIKLLLLEMHRAIGNLSQADIELSSEEIALQSKVPAPFVDPSLEFKSANNLNALRKAARKAVILPVTVNYLNGETALQFHTYTVNVCEDGACIVFSSQNFEDLLEVGVQMPQEFSSQARIRWVQPSREDSFRLAGIEFLNQKMAMNSL
jgi:hypothetical protein